MMWIFVLTRKTENDGIETLVRYSIDANFTKERECFRSFGWKVQVFKVMAEGQTEIMQ
jgi:hypothetical protein